MNTYIDVLEKHAQNIPDHPLYTFLDDKGSEVSELSYQEFQLRSKSIAAWLQKKLGNRVKGARILLLYEPGLEFICGFFGCLYAGAIAVPAYPPDVRQLNKSLPRIDGIVNDCGATLVFTNSNIKNALKLIRLRMPNLYFKSIIATDEIPIARADEWQMPEVNAEDIAFLQYTSGSTSQPKGVMVSHKNLLHNSETIKNFYGHDHNSKGVIWLPSYHDMGLIGGLLQTIYLGVQTWLISPISFIKNPYLWLKLISEKGASTSGGPNFAYELCLKRISPEQKKNLDLSKWKIAFSGAEPVKIETINKFSEFFAECGFRKEAFYPCYGLAEATLIVTGVEKLKGPHDINLNSELLTQNKVKLSDQSDERTLNYVSCGHSTNDQELIIVDPHTKQKISEDEVGEVWVKGPSIALGYWKKEEATKEIFNAYTLNGEGPYLRTGDKGFLHEKELYITGRIKDLIIINGKNHYPQDIELTVEKSDKAIRGGGVVAFAIDKEGREELVVLAEMKSGELDKSGLINKIKNKVRESHELLINDLVFIKPRTIPKTSSGKLQRYLCKQLYLSGQFNSYGLVDKKKFIQFDFLKQGNFKNLFFRRDRSIEITARNIEKWFVERVAQELKISSKEVDVKKPISSYLDSVLMVGIAGDLSMWLKSNFDPAHFVGSHSIESIAQSYSNKSSSKKIKKLYKQFNHLNKLNPLSVNLNIKNILLTGGTGVLGAYLLKELLEEPSIEKIYCLVRAKNKDQGLERIKKSLNVYTQSLNSLLSQKIIPVVGDITSVNFNLPDEDYVRLTTQVDGVIHAASSTNLFLSYELLKQTNVLGTQHVVDFALRTKNKYLIYISSYSVMGDLIKKNNFVFKESDFDLGQKFDHMGYQETKFEAEALVRQAALDKGLLFNIFRPGNIFGDSKTGFYPFDSEGVSHLYYEILDLIIETKISAQTRMVFDITPVDYVSKGILNLGLKQERVNQTYHLLNPDVKSWRQIVRMIIELGFKIQLMSLSRYFRVINSPKMKQLDPRFNKIFSLMRYGFADARFFNSGAYCSSKNTAELLAKQNINCPKISMNLIGKFIESYQNRSASKKMFPVSKID